MVNVGVEVYEAGDSHLPHALEEPDTGIETVCAMYEYVVWEISRLARLGSISQQFSSAARMQALVAEVGQEVWLCTTIGEINTDSLNFVGSCA